MSTINTLQAQYAINDDFLSSTERHRAKRADERNKNARRNSTVRNSERRVRGK